MEQRNIRIYGAVWCPDTSRAMRIFDNNQITFIWYDVDKDKAARAFVEKINNGECRIPTIVFIDGSMLIEPEDQELESKLLSLT